MGQKMDLMSKEFVTALMRRQFILSSKLAAVFVSIIAAVPLLNKYAPEMMNTELFGMTVSWFFLGFGIFPILIGLAWLFVRRSNAFEDEAIGMVDPYTLPKHHELHVSGTPAVAPAAAGANS